MAKNNSVKLIVMIVLAAIFISPLLPIPEITGSATQVVIKAAPQPPHPQLKIISFLNRPITPHAGDLVTFTLTVKNYGDKSNPTAVDFYVNGVVIKTMPVEAIDSHAATTVKTTWTAPTQGNYVAIANVSVVPGEIYIADNVNKITFRVL